MGTEPLLELDSIVKSFGGTPVLSGVALTMKPGEILGLVGENGAGKSTLVKCLLGIHRPDSGTIRFLGRPLRAGEPEIAGIPQEFNLVGDLTVAENIFLGREPVRFGLIDRKTLNRNARAGLARLGVEMDPDRKSHRSASRKNRWWRSPRRSPSNAVC